MTLKFNRLSRAAIRGLAPRQKIGEHGIVAERLTDGDVRYTVNVMVDGKRIHRVIGKSSDGVTRAQAEEFIAQAQTDARAGRLSLPKAGSSRCPSTGPAPAIWRAWSSPGAGTSR